MKRLALSLVILIALILQSYFNSRCHAIHHNGADITVTGVWCWRRVGMFDEWNRLSEIEARLSAPKLESDPRLIPAKPTVESANG